MGQAGSGLATFTSGNNIYVQTSSGQYTAGDVVQGTAYLNALKPFNSRGVYLYLEGYERTKWDERYYEQVRDGTDAEGNPKYRRVERHRHFGGHRYVLKMEIPLSQWQGQVPSGQYEFPFQFKLPDGLPGSYQESGRTNQNGNRQDYRIEILYKLVAKVDVPWGKDVKHTHPIIVNGKLQQDIYQQQVEHQRSITQCCCINKGNAWMRAKFNKDAFVPGETAQIQCEVVNASSVDLKKVKSKLMRELEIRSHNGQTLRIRQEVHRQEYPGVPANTRCLAPGAQGPTFETEASEENPIQDQGGARMVPLQIPASTRPTTQGNLIRCKYWCDVELDVPWGGDVEVTLPFAIYAPQSPSYQYIQQPPPGWNSQVIDAGMLNVDMNMGGAMDHTQVDVKMGAYDMGMGGMGGDGMGEVKVQATYQGGMGSGMDNNMGQQPMGQQQMGQQQMGQQQMGQQQMGGMGGGMNQNYGATSNNGGMGGM